MVRLVGVLTIFDDLFAQRLERRLRPHVYFEHDGIKREQLKGATREVVLLDPPFLVTGADGFALIVRRAVAMDVL